MNKGRAEHGPYSVDEEKVSDYQMDKMLRNDPAFYRCPTCGRWNLKENGPCPLCPN